MRKFLALLGFLTMLCGSAFGQACPTPSITPAGGTYKNPVTVTLGTAGLCNVSYTTDGSTPTTFSPVYSGPFTVSVTTTVKAFAWKVLYTSSSIVSAIYTINSAATASRWDWTAQTINTGYPIPGGLYPALNIPNIPVQLCNAPAIGNPCTNFATTYTDATATTSCPTSTQLTRSGTNICINNTDSTGGFGAWLLPGCYQYTIQPNYGAAGPYDFCVGSGNGGGGGGGACGSNNIPCTNTANTYTAPTVNNPQLIISGTSTTVPLSLKSSNAGTIANPTFVQGAVNCGGPPGECQVGLSGIAAGDALVIILYGWSGGTPAVASTNSNVFTTVGTDTPSTQAMFVDCNANAGSDTFTVTHTFELAIAQVVEYHNVANSACIDGAVFGGTAPGGGGIGNGPYSTPTLTTTNANDVVVSAITPVTGGGITTYTLPSGYSALYIQTSSVQIFTAGQAQTNTGTFTPTWSFTVGATTSAGAITYGLKAGGSSYQSVDIFDVEDSTGTIQSGFNNYFQPFVPQFSGSCPNVPTGAALAFCNGTFQGYNPGSSSWGSLGGGGNISGAISSPFIPKATGANTIANSDLEETSSSQLLFGGAGGFALSSSAQAATFRGVANATIPSAAIPANYTGNAGATSGTPQYLLQDCNTPPSGGQYQVFSTPTSVNGVNQAGCAWQTPGSSPNAGFGTLTVDVDNHYSGANAGAKLIACLADSTLAPGTICDMRSILNEATQPVPLGTAPIEVGRNGPQSVLWPSCIGPTNSHCGAVLQTTSTTLATPGTPTATCSTTGGSFVATSGEVIYVKVNYRTGDAVSASSAETSCTMSANTSTGSIQVTGPATCPAYTSEYDVTMSTTSGSETWQMNQNCGSSVTWTQQQFFPVSSAAPSAATPVPSIIIHNNKSEFYALSSGQNGFPFYTTSGTVATDLLATTDNGYSSIRNIFLYDNGGGTIPYGMADVGAYVQSKRDYISIAAGTTYGLHVFGQYNVVNWNSPNISCIGNTCSVAKFEWSPQTVGDGESMGALNFWGGLINTQNLSSNTGNGIIITGRSGAGSTFWTSNGSGVGSFNFYGTRFQMGASNAVGVLITDATNIHLNGIDATRQSFGGTAFVSINQTYHQSGQTYQSGPVEIDGASYINGWTDVVLNNVSTDPLATIAGVSGVSYSNGYKWCGSTCSLNSGPPYPYQSFLDGPVVFGAAAPVTINSITAGKIVGTGTNGLLQTITIGSGLSFTSNTLTATGSGGTVTSFSAGNLSPLFTTSVATATTTPALTFTLSNAAQNSVLAGPATGGAGAPSYQTAPTFSAANLTNLPACATCVTSAASLTSTAIMTGAGSQASQTPSSLATVNSSGQITAAQLLATGIVDGTAPVTITTSSTGTIGGTYKSGYTINNDGSTAVTYTLPTASAGLQYCMFNIAGATGTLEILTSASGQFIDNAGTNSASGGYVISGGALGDAACVTGEDSTHWKLWVQGGTWTTH